MELPPTVMMIHLPSISHPPPKDVSVTEAHFNIVIIFLVLLSWNAQGFLQQLKL